jgi:hypothetical protein
MQGLEWVLDTWVLVKSDEPMDDRAADAVSLLNEIWRQHQVAIDHEGLIEEEYQDNIAPRGHAAKWWIRMVSFAGKICRRSGKLDRRHSSRLLDALRFHDDDLPFVAVAATGPDHLLVAEESDYRAEVREYLTDKLRIKVLTVSEALELAQDP